MAYDLQKFSKYTWLAGLVGFYQVYAVKNPADPFGQMYNDLMYYLNGITNGQAWTKIQTKLNYIITIIALLIATPLVLGIMKGKVPVWVKIIINGAVYYFIGDQAARILDDPGYSGANGRARTWSQPTSAYHVNQYTPSAGVVKNIYGG